MSESLLSFIIILAEIGAVLLILFLVGFVLFYRRNRDDHKHSKKLVEKIKKIIPARRDKLLGYFSLDDAMDDNQAGLSANNLIESEKQLYNHMINAVVSKDMDSLGFTMDDLTALLDDYIHLLVLKEDIEDNDETKESRELTLKKENEVLRQQMMVLQKKLDAETEAIKNMMNEFSSMYEGGKKEGEQRVKNEMYKLQQSLQVAPSDSIDLDLDKKEKDEPE